MTGSATTRRRGAALWTAVGAWVLLLVFALGGLAAHAERAGETGRPAAAWPAASGLPTRPGQPTVVALLHPECPCSRATVTELAAMRAQAASPFVLDVVLVGRVVDRQGAAMQAAVASLGDVHVRDDPAGVEAARFGARTSGLVLVYDAAGALRWAGGITRARGHEGANAGRDAALAAIAGARPDVAEHPVFGCALAGARAPDPLDPWTRLVRDANRALRRTWERFS